MRIGVSDAHGTALALAMRMKIAPRTPILLSRRPVAAPPSAEPHRSTGPLSMSTATQPKSAQSGVRGRPVLLARDIVPRGPAATTSVVSSRPEGRSAPVAPADRPSATSAPQGTGADHASRRPVPGFHGAVTEFKRRLIETTLTDLGGNRTRAARALGLQRTYLLRLIREFAVRVPAGTAAPRRGGETPGTAPAPPRER